MNRRSLIFLTVAIAVVGFVGATWWAVRPSAEPESAAVSPAIDDRLIRSHSPSLGPVDAPVTIVEFFDPACEACRAFYPVVKDILARYPRQVRVVLRYTPFHGEASEEAILALEAARVQGVYEPVLEALLREQQRWASHGTPPTGGVLAIAAAAGLDAGEARKQMQTPALMAILNQDRADVEALGIRGTPTFFVNGKPLKVFGEEELRALVAREVDAVGS